MALCFTGFIMSFAPFILKISLFRMVVFLNIDCHILFTCLAILKTLKTPLWACFEGSANNTTR